MNQQLTDLQAYLREINRKLRTHPGNYKGVVLLRDDGSYGVAVGARLFPDRFVVIADALAFIAVKLGPEIFSTPETA